MPREHKCSGGDCIASLGVKYGLFPDTIWDDAANSDLRELRKNPNVLSAGDVVTIPDKRVKSVSKPSDEHHKFKRRGVPEKLVMQLLRMGEPRASQEYTIVIDGRVTQGRTDGEGRLEHWIPPDATDGRLLVGKNEEYVLEIGNLPPLSEKAGIRRRLANLGFYEGDQDDESQLKLAIEAFQSHVGLPVTGKADRETQERIREEHGC